LSKFDGASGTLKVVVYHGNKRATSAEELEDVDVVLTTYSIIESEFRRHTQPNKATCTYCNKKFYPDRLKVHLRCSLNSRCPPHLLSPIWTAS
jgi:DNA repair protein RAD16